MIGIPDTVLSIWSLLECNCEGMSVCGMIPRHLFFSMGTIKYIVLCIDYIGLFFFDLCLISDLTKFSKLYAWLIFAKWQKESTANADGNVWSYWSIILICWLVVSGKDSSILFGPKWWTHRAPLSSSAGLKLVAEVQKCWYISTKCVKWAPESPQMGQVLKDLKVLPYSFHVSWIPVRSSRPFLSEAGDGASHRPSHATTVGRDNSVSSDDGRQQLPHCSEHERLREPHRHQRTDWKLLSMSTNHCKHCCTGNDSTQLYLCHWSNSGQ